MRNTLATSPFALIALIATQSFCALFFLLDVITDLGEIGGKPTSHLLVEALASGTLVLAILMEVRMILSLMQRKARLEDSLKEASRAVFEVIESHFEMWSLSPSERDVASFLVKGFSISEIAELRGNKEGTIKAHLNAIYRKSGTRNRAELMSVLIDSLI
ncbi:helix-turn-helix transcriptional regulator [Celeribacter persicus]|jgi:Response regulator containing a CheY-like receiver domain and an HTH DNA-binding domain|uniref:Regulatory LuxR family protein n=1 Tax=Celeribacter persicus TaxID=1651082 RepID=A0A2T5HUH5_9RHOB|nr:helix-turn-helix transcriptional regulator [Celeribacter persicus]PTQ75249.1 regulatory LuxR family protein [Celeribacter persicus]